MKLSLCITTYNRVDLTIKSFAQILNDDRISEIIIVDDASSGTIYSELNSKILTLNATKPIHLFRNVVNLGMSRNKAKAISYANKEWCIIFDSDNIIDSSYLDALEMWTDLKSERFNFKNTIFCPSFARPQFDFTHYSGLSIDRFNAPRLIKNDIINTSFNACNYVVNRDEYRRVYEYNPEHLGTDTAYFGLLWLKAGNRFLIVDNMEYDHLVHKDSGFMKDVNYNMTQAEKVRKLIMQL